jgi:hypothetical protein
MGDYRGESTRGGKKGGRERRKGKGKDRKSVKILLPDEFST